MIARTTFTNTTHENTTVVSKHKPGDQTKSNKMLYLADTSLWSRDMDNYKITVLSRLDAFEVWVYRRVLKISWT